MFISCTAEAYLPYCHKEKFPLAFHSPNTYLASTISFQSEDGMVATSGKVVPSHPKGKDLSVCAPGNWHLITALLSVSCTFSSSGFQVQCPNTSLSSALCFISTSQPLPSCCLNFLHFPLPPCYKMPNECSCDTVLSTCLQSHLCKMSKLSFHFPPHL